MPYKDRSKQRKYQLDFVVRRRREYFKDQKCLICGSLKKLVLHHMVPSEKNSHKIWSWRKERREEELKKCIILCDNCHKEIHGKYKNEEWHGKRHGYEVKKCRCLKCKEYKRRINKKYSMKRDGEMVSYRIHDPEIAGSNPVSR